MRFYPGGRIEFVDPIETDAEIAAQRADALAKQADIYCKRWHQAADQRDALVRAARSALRRDDNRSTALDALCEVLERVEAEDPPVSAKSSTLRRELWAVLDRMPASDDVLIATVRALAWSAFIGRIPGAARPASRTGEGPK
jgi:hypothetical protein